MDSHEPLHDPFGSSQRDVLPMTPGNPVFGDSAESNAEPLIVVDDATVISHNPPLESDAAYLNLRPKELGEALLGQQLGDVVLEKFVGGGGMGAVFRGHDLVLHRSVAVKVLSTLQAGDAETLRRFQTEARSAARLDHPGIARVFQVGQQRGLRYIVFEYIDGINLRDVVSTRGPLPVDEAVSLTLQVADALVHAWQRQVVHRDIKPSNILITPGGVAKLVDMGLARLDQSDQQDQDATATGMTLGTFDYIAPEQARDPRLADTRADIYSLGCTLFYMLTAQPPFPGGTPLQKLLAHQGDRPPSLETFRSDLPAGVIELVEFMLAKNPADRFQNPMELVSALLGLGESLGVRRPKLVATLFASAAPATLPSWTRHLPWAIPTLLLTLAVGTLAALDGRSAEAPAFESEPLEIELPEMQSELELRTNPDVGPVAPSGGTTAPIAIP
jgi:serine/threonine-protein kinase